MVVAQQDVSEIARERETFKYDALTISTAGLRGPHPPKSIPSVFLSSTPDPGLTAFAQLGLYKLNASRSMISLFDRKYQHIVAEALRPEPGQRDNKEDQNWFNGLAFERLTSVCEHVVTGGAVAQSIPGTEHGLGVADIPVSIIKHLDGDRRFCHIQDPKRQFYAGVPIRSPAGINIGVYCIFDSKPRPEGLNAEEVRFIRDMSKVVMDYLESKRSHECYRREQRIVRGMGSLINGEATLWKEDDSAASVPTAFRDIAGLSEGLLNKKLQSTTTAASGLQHTEPNTASDQELPISYEYPPNFGSHDVQEPQTRVTTGPVQSPKSPSPVTKPIEATIDTNPAAEIPILAPAAVVIEPPVIKPRSGLTGSLRSEIEHNFSRAANVIREAFEVQGVLFLDASIRSYGGLVTNISSETEPCSSGPSGSDDGRRSPSSPSTTRSPSLCDVLGFSKTHSSSILGDDVPKEFKQCKEWFLQRLLRRHPRGRTWNFESDGTLCDPAANSESDLSPGESLEAPLSALRETAKINDNGQKGSKSSKKLINTAARIIKMFPGARSVAMIPLWDAQTGRVYAGGFMWTKTPTRTFSEETELSCLRVFALTVMSDVARLKLQSAEEAKTDILGSISHELRSPLHGLVGAVELLRDTSLNTMQDGILNAIESSGRTLLDTIEHLLDYVKTTSKKSARSRRRGSIDARQRLSPTTGPAVQLDLLLEEVVESVLAGYKHLAKSQTHSATPFTASSQQRVLISKGSHPSGDELVASQSSGGTVQCSLDIDHSAKWAFRMHPGAFRRVVMNLFGNSLKFTTSGFIHVSLRQESQADPKGTPGTTRVVLTVSDSGKGMTESFLRNHLFTPFTQEDQFAVGTGLGLSLVRHTTEAYGGTIDVSSKVGVGTTIAVTLPLLPVAEQAPDNDETSFWQDVKSLAGRRIQFCNSASGAIRDALDAGGAKPKSQHQLIEAICQNSLGMIIISTHQLDPVLPDYIICVAGNGHTCSDASSRQTTSQCPYVFICEDLAAAHKSSAVDNGGLPGIYEFCSQPVGLRKLARILLSCQRRWLAFQDSGTALKSQTNHAVPSTQMQQEEPKHSPTPAPPALTLRLAHEKKYSMSIESDLPSKAEQGNGIVPTSQALVAQPKVAVIDAGVLKVLPVASDVRKPILIVDDNQINLKVMAAYLTKLKYTSVSATNGLEALNLYKEDPSKYSCVLTDISMPVMDGLESTRRIREFELSSSRKSVVVIALTGLDRAGVQQDALASGVDLFLTRPLTIRGLEKALLAMGLG